MIDLTDHQALINRIRERDIRAVAKAMSALEDDPSFAPQFIPALTPFYKKKPRLGITGSPGVGKSTVVNRLVQELRAQDQRVGVVAVDPTSPFSGGAILGDRVRMVGVQNDPQVYIRSLGSRGSLGGLSAATANIVRVLETFGVDTVIIETVGMGQTGFDIVDIADTVVLILSPESGDGVQTMKAGVMEVADIYAVNKADRPGADGLATEIKSLLGMVDGRLQWVPPVLTMSAVDDTGVSEILGHFARHLSFLTEHGLVADKRLRQLANEIRFLVESRIKGYMLEDARHKTSLRELAAKVEARELDTYAAADAVCAMIMRSLAEDITDAKT